MDDQRMDGDEGGDRDKDVLKAAAQHDFEGMDLSKNKQRQKRNAGVLRCAQNDSKKQPQRREAGLPLSAKDDNVAGLLQT